MGWASNAEWPVPASDLSVGYKRRLTEAQGGRIRLQWRLLPAACCVWDEEEVWETRRVAGIPGYSVLVLDPTDQLWHAGAQGPASPVRPLFERVVDAMLILGAAGEEIEWERFIVQIQKRGLLSSVLETLEFLQDRPGGPLPDGIYRRIQRLPVSRRDQIAYGVRTRLGLWWRRFPSLWFHHSERECEGGFLRRLVRFPGFLQRAWRLDHLWQVPLHMIAESGRRLTRR